MHSQVHVSSIQISCLEIQVSAAVVSNVLDSLNGINPNVKLNANTSRNNSFEMKIDYTKMADAFFLIHTQCSNF